MTTTNNKNPGPLYANGKAKANGFQDASGNFYNFARYQFDSKNPLLSVEAHGLWRRRWMFAVYKGTPYYRKTTFWDLHRPRTLNAGRLKWAAAIRAWQGLQKDTKRALDSRASQLGLRCSGFNYFTKLWMSDHPDLNKYYP
jgi:hypothetical protein